MKKRLLVNTFLRNNGNLIKCLLSEFSRFFLLLLLQVYQLSIAAACGLSWPSDRVIIQILDDSTDPVVKVVLIRYLKST